jgi:hypothetical protein
MEHRQAAQRPIVNRTTPRRVKLEILLGPKFRCCLALKKCQHRCQVQDRIRGIFISLTIGYSLRIKSSCLDYCRSVGAIHRDKTF